MVPEPCECELFQRVRGGDRIAFDRLRVQLEPRVRRFIFRLVGKSPAEEDILQDAFLALYVNRARVEPVGNLLPFLFRIVRNRCYDELRRKGRFQWVSLDDDPEQTGITPAALLDSRPRPDETVYWALAMAEVRKAIDRLPELQRQTLILYCEEDLSYEQIAAAMGCDLGTVKSRLHNGRRHLRRALRPEVLQTIGIEEETRADTDRSRTARPSR
jgi:RNA polymerase sigma-70 factor (ECF subfamily)